MAPLKVGDTLPDGVVFEWAPIVDDDPTVCTRPIEYEASKEWKDKKVVLFSVPGAFTPGCQGMHLPPYIEQSERFRAKGVDIIAVIGYNDSFVMNAWGKVNGIKGDDILFLSDTKSFFSKEHGWMTGNGPRNGRWAMIFDKGKVIYSESESGPGQVTVSGADATLAKL